MLKVIDVAKLLDVSERTVRNLIQRGRLACYRIGVGRGVIRISQAAVDQMLADSQVEAAPPPARGAARPRTLRHLKL